LCEHCPAWNGSGWHWSVWQGHCRTFWSVNESPKDLSHSELLVFGLCPSSSILEIRKQCFETGYVSVLRWGKTPILLSPSERANLNHWTRQWTKSKNAVILSIIYHHQNPLEYTYSSHGYTYWNHC
jgi:hypothetical protein